jgi:hypothetical protein
MFVDAEIRSMSCHCRNDCKYLVPRLSLRYLIYGVKNPAHKPTGDRFEHYMHSH